MNEAISTPPSRALFHVSAAEAPYHRALYEALAPKLPAAGFSDFQIALPDRQAAGNAEFASSSVHPRSAELHLHLLPTASFKKKHGNLLPSPKLWSLLKKTDPAVIWSHEYSIFNWPAFLFAWKYRRPVLVSTEIGQANLADMGLTARLTRRIFGPLVRGIIANSPAAMHPVEAVPETAIARAWYASETRPAPLARQPDPEGRLRLVFLGHLIARKGIDLLLEAVQIAEKSGASFRVTLIGNPTPWCSDVIAQFKGRSPIIQAGFLEGDAADRVLREQDVFVLPSRYDTYGAVVHEAASRGLALVVSRHAGASALALPEGNGFVIDPQDTTGFAATLTSLANSPGLVDSLGHRATLVAREYGAEANADRVISLLKLLNAPLRH